ncbi:Myeloid lymphoid or mixed-lineage leukemia (trithorax, ) [Polyrhizophydium stewartii]|uniref:Protein AF-9 homolog n=1 Tax=Polyrhizophydium stewartii TaxID=2732419 RepID=A0ABR4NGN5_9FUNG
MLQTRETTKGRSPDAVVKHIRIQTASQRTHRLAHLGAAAPSDRASAHSPAWCLGRTVPATAAAHAPPASSPGFLHKWIVSVLSASPASPNHLPFIDRVVFFLHETFANPVRTVSSPPFEISEEGWGGFVMNIELHFKGNAFPPHTLQHDFHLDMPQYSAIERLVFPSPPPAFLALLNETIPPWRSQARHTSGRLRNDGRESITAQQSELWMHTRSESANSASSKLSTPTRPPHTGHKSMPISLLATPSHAAQQHLAEQQLAASLFGSPMLLSLATPACGSSASSASQSSDASTADQQGAIATSLWMRDKADQYTSPESETDSQGSVCLDQPSVRDSLVQSLHALDKSSMIEVGRLVKLASLSNPSIYVRELRGETELFEFDLDTLDRPLLQAIYNIVHGLRHSSPLDAI